jgi:adenylate kinase family enzyme
MLLCIFGAPGVGKTTVMQYLNDVIQCPNLEMSWMPEFRRKGAQAISYEEDEAIAIENLILLAANYLKHGYPLVALSDMRIEQMAHTLALLDGLPHRIVKLVIQDEQELKRRVLDETRTSAYRDWQSALEINRLLMNTHYPNEMLVDVTGKTVDAIVNEMLNPYA